MSIRPGSSRVPKRLQTAMGVLLTTGLAVAAVAGVTLPRVLGPRPSDGAPDVARAAAAAEQIWRAAVSAIAAARGVDADEALIGPELTPLVTTVGEVEAKRVSVSPAWAGVIVRELHGAGLRRGDVVAASFSGSFPGINLAVATACQALDLRLVAVSSVTASSWGASQSGFTWPEMEAWLVGEGLLRQATVAVSAGGEGDRALDLDDEGRRLARAIAEASARRLQARLIDPADFDASVRARLDAFDAARAGRPIAAFVNVGGTEAALGRSAAILKVQNGWLGGAPFDASPGRGLVARMVDQGVPVLHILNVRDLAMRWGIL